MKNAKELGKSISYLREIKKMKQKDLAEKIEKSASYLCDIEKSRVIPSLKVVFKISEALGVEIPEHFYQERSNNDGN